MFRFMEKLKNKLKYELTRRKEKRVMKKYEVYIGSYSAVAKAKKKMTGKYIILQGVSYMRGTNVVRVDEIDLKKKILKDHRLFEIN